MIGQFCLTRLLQRNIIFVALLLCRFGYLDLNWIPISSMCDSFFRNNYPKISRPNMEFTCDYFGPIVNSSSNARRFLFCNKLTV